MNRRDFLKSLLASGVSIALPFDVLSATPDAVIEEAWQSALKNPAVFYVRGESGAITTSAGPEYWPASRGELYDLEVPTSIDEVINLADENADVVTIIENAQYDVGDNGNWRQWVATLSTDQQEVLIQDAAKWVSGPPDDYDWEAATFSGNTGEGWALNYFRDEFPYCDELDIAIIEGECPGSSYYAAELQISVEDANERAKALGIPIRFA
jgi:hypothetical protein